MRSLYSTLLMLIFISLTGCSNEAFEDDIINSPANQPFNVHHSLSNKLQEIIDEFTEKGLPGVVVAVKDKEGVWEGVSGYAKLETSTKLSTGFVHAGGSITKIYTATAIMKLKEMNKIDLDNSIKNYLPENIVSKINDSDKITVRMLLNHTSGIRDYIDNPNFRMQWFNDLSKRWTVEQALSYAYQKPLLFDPGSEFYYSNNNYILLSLMISYVTGQDEAVWQKDHIFQPFQLSNTYYKAQPEYVEKLPMPNYYLDRYGDGRLQNVTVPTKVEICSELGDGGLVATAIDFVEFMDALVKGHIISLESFEEMKKVYYNDYGLGIDVFNYNDEPQFGHSGAVFGGASLMLYFQEEDIVVFIASNTDGALVGGKTLILYHEMKNKIGDFLASYKN